MIEPYYKVVIVDNGIDAIKYFKKPRSVRRKRKNSFMDTVKESKVFVRKHSLAKYELTKVEIIFMDVNMPGKNGVEATKELRAMGLTIPIIGLSANYFEEKRCLRAGMDGFLIKPCQPKCIQNLVNKSFVHNHLSNEPPDAVFNCSRSLKCMVPPK